MFKWLLFLSIALLFSTSSLYGQERHSDAQINLGYDAFLQSELSLKSINAQFVLFPEKKFSFLYSVGFGVTDHNKFYSHFPLGAFWGVYLLAYSEGWDNELITTLAILSMLIPEGVCYNIDVNEKMRLSPYLNFNSHELYYSESENLTLKASLSIGSKFSYKIKERVGCTFSIGAKVLSANGFGIHSNAALFYQF